jgi:acyl-CoA thioester hydrolase
MVSMASVVQIPLQIRFGDIDSNGHVNNVTYAAYLETARVQLTHLALGAAAGEGAEASQTLSELMGEENFTLVGRQEIEYLAPLLFRIEPIYINVWVTAIGGSSYELSYTVGEEDDSVIYCHASTGMVLVNRKSGRPVRLSPQIRHALRSWSGEPLPFRRRPVAAAQRPEAAPGSEAASGPAEAATPAQSAATGEAGA